MQEGQLCSANPIATQQVVYRITPEDLEGVTTAYAKLTLICAHARGIKTVDVTDTMIAQLVSANRHLVTKIEKVIDKYKCLTCPGELHAGKLLKLPLIWKQEDAYMDPGDVVPGPSSAATKSDTADPSPIIRRPGFLPKPNGKQTIPGGRGTTTDEADEATDVADVDQGGGEVTDVAAKKESSILPILALATLGAATIWWMMRK